MKRKYVRLNSLALKQIVTQHDFPTYIRVIQGIPASAKLVKWGFVPSEISQDEDFVYLTFEDESFPEILEGVCIDSTNIIVRTHSFANEESLVSVDLRS